MKIFTLITGIHVLIFFLLFWALGTVNASFAAQEIPCPQIAVATALYTLYAWMLSLVYWHIWHGRWWTRLLSVSVIVALAISLFPIVEHLVFNVLPAWDIQFFDPSKDVNLGAFHFRLVRGYMFTNLVALLLVCGLTLVRQRHRSKKAEEMWQRHKHRVADMRYTSHFLNTLLVSEFGKMLVDGIPNDSHRRRDIVQFVGYLLQIEELGATSSWSEELEQLECFIRLLKAYYSAEAIDAHIDHRPGRYPAIPKGILLFPLENCLRHARITPEHPVRYRLWARQTEAILQCTNYWSPKGGQTSTGTGFDLLRAKIAEAPFPIRFEYRKTATDYELRLYLNWKDNEKTPVQSDAA